MTKSHYRDFCRRYRLDPSTDEARAQYQQAQEALRTLYSVTSKEAAQEAIDKTRGNR